MLKFYSTCLVVLGVVVMIISILAACAFGGYMLVATSGGPTMITLITVAFGFGGVAIGAAIGAVGELLQMIVKIEENTRPILLTP